MGFLAVRVLQIYIDQLRSRSHLSARDLRRFFKFLGFDQAFEFPASHFIRSLTDDQGAA